MDRAELDLSRIEARASSLHWELSEIIARNDDRTKVVVLRSGGMDSVSALHHANAVHEVVAALSFDYGSKHNDKEIPLAECHGHKLCIPHTTIRLSLINDLFKCNCCNSGDHIRDGHYEEAGMKQPSSVFETVSCWRSRAALQKVTTPKAW